MHSLPIAIFVLVNTGVQNKQRNDHSSVTTTRSRILTYVHYHKTMLLLFLRPDKQRQGNTGNSCFVVVVVVVGEGALFKTKEARYDQTYMRLSRLYFSAYHQYVQRHLTSVRGEFFFIEALCLGQYHWLDHFLPGWRTRRIGLQSIRTMRLVIGHCTRK